MAGLPVQRVDAGAQHCVSHFRPFCKIDIFYLSEEGLKPSPWYGLPHTILHDPSGVIITLSARSKGLSFATSIEEVDHSISKGLAAAHEAYRQAHRENSSMLRRSSMSCAITL